MIVKPSSLEFPFKVEKLEEEIMNLKTDQEIETEKLNDSIVQLNPVQEVIDIDFPVIIAMCTTYRPSFPPYTHVHWTQDILRITGNLDEYFQEVT